MSAKVSTAILLTLAVFAFGGAAFVPSTASALIRAQPFAASQVVKGATVHSNHWWSWCSHGPACHPPNAIFATPRNPGNAVFAK